MAADNQYRCFSFRLSYTTDRQYSILLVLRVAQNPWNVSTDLETYNLPVSSRRTRAHLHEYVYSFLFWTNARTLLGQQEISYLLSYMRSNGRNIISHSGPYWLASHRSLSGASGSILGMLAAAAILFPKMLVYVFGIFPLKMSVLAIILAVISILSVLRPDVVDNAGGEAAHLGGMVAGAIYVLTEKHRRRLKMKVQNGMWERKKVEHRDLHLEVDRILKKVHDHGLHSLTHKEKKVLKQATKSEQMRNK